MAESIVFYKSFFDAIVGSGLSESDQLAAFIAICQYGLYGTTPNVTGMPFGIFTIAKESIDANARRRDGGKKGGRPRKETKGLETENHRFPKTKSTETETVTVTVTETGTDKADKPHARKKFVPPSVEEVRSFCSERGNGIDAQRFCDFYEARGWMAGKNHMKDWRAAVRTWESRDKKASPIREEDYTW